MEDDLNFSYMNDDLFVCLKGRLPDFFPGNGRQSYIFQIKDDLTLFSMEDAIFFSYGRQT